MAIMEEKTSSNLPPEIKEIILSKSSVKSLLRFKSVCKSWNTIISDPVFIQTHLQNSPNNLLLCNYRTYSEGGFHLFESEGTRKLRPKAVLQNTHKGCNLILGECNGVLLLSESFQRCTEYVLWNPSTRRGVYLKSPYGRRVNRGICYDSITGDFKVVLFGKMTYEIYSCKNSCWTEKKLGFQYSGSCSGGIYVDGATYWVLRDVNSQTVQILYFDPIVEELKMLQKPEQLSCYDRDNYCLFVSVACLRGNLCLCCGTGDDDDDYDGKTKIQIWIKEKGINVGENIPIWKEFVTFERKPFNWWGAKPRCFVGNKILIQLDAKRFVYYSPSEKTFEELETDHIDRHDCELIPYRSSLYFSTGVKMETRSVS